MWLESHLNVLRPTLRDINVLLKFCTTHAFSSCSSLQNISVQEGTCTQALCFEQFRFQMGF